MHIQIITIYMCILYMFWLFNLCRYPNFVHISFKVARLRAKNLKISLLVEGGAGSHGAYPVISLWYLKLCPHCVRFAKISVPAYLKKNTRCNHMHLVNIRFVICHIWWSMIFAPYVKRKRLSPKWTFWTTILS